jgi:hypothetical protein
MYAHRLEELSEIKQTGLKLKGFPYFTAAVMFPQCVFSMRKGAALKIITSDEYFGDFNYIVVA